MRIRQRSDSGSEPEIFVILIVHISLANMGVYCILFLGDMRYKHFMYFESSKYNIVTHFASLHVCVCIEVGLPTYLHDKKLVFTR